MQYRFTAISQVNVRYILLSVEKILITSHHVMYVISWLVDINTLLQEHTTMWWSEGLDKDILVGGLSTQTSIHNCKKICTVICYQWQLHVTWARRKKNIENVITMFILFPLQNLISDKCEIMLSSDWSPEPTSSYVSMSSCLLCMRVFLACCTILHTSDSVSFMWTWQFVCFIRVAVSSVPILEYNWLIGQLLIKTCPLTKSSNQ